MLGTKPIGISMWFQSLSFRWILSTSPASGCIMQSWKRMVISWGTLQSFGLTWLLFRKETRNSRKWQWLIKFNAFGKHSKGLASTSRLRQMASRIYHSRLCKLSWTSVALRTMVTQGAQQVRKEATPIWGGKEATPIPGAISARWLFEMLAGPANWAGPANLAGLGKGADPKGKEPPHNAGMGRCYACEETGHWQKECRMRQRQGFLSAIPAFKAPSLQVLRHPSNKVHVPKVKGQVKPSFWEHQDADPDVNSMANVWDDHLDATEFAVNSQRCQ